MNGAARHTREALGVAPTDGIPWVAARHALGAARLLTADDPRAANPPGFRGELYPPQQALLAAMTALEAHPFVAVEDPRCPEAWGGCLQTGVGRVSEKCSFGKTVLSIALACAPPPALYPCQQPLATYPGKDTRRGNRARVVANLATVGESAGGFAFDPAGGYGFLPEITAHYGRHLGRLTVVAAAANVITQWEDEARRLTNLRYLIVDDVHSLRAFERAFRRGELDDEAPQAVRLAIVKAGTVTTSFKVPGEPPRPNTLSKTRSILEAFATVLEGVLVGRFIVDDFDMLRLKGDDCFLPARFTWLVSATRRQAPVKVPLHVNHATVGEFLRANLMAQFPVRGAVLDDVLNKAFSLHCAPEFVDTHINSTRINFRRVFVRGGQAAAILRDLEVAPEVIEMVNADAVSAAARGLNIDAGSIGDVIRQVVGKCLAQLRRALRTRGRARHARAAGVREAARDAAAKNVNAEAAAKALRAALTDGTDDEFAAALAAAIAAGPGPASLQQLEEDAAAECERHGKPLNRMRENIREGCCQCCMVPLERGTEPAYVLVDCCQIVVCESCVTRRALPSTSVDASMRMSPGRVFIRRCPNCARDFDPRSGLIRIGAELDLEAALRDDAVVEGGDASAADAADAAVAAEGGLDASAAVAAEGGLDAAEGGLDVLNNPRLKALIQLLRGGEALDCIRDVAVPSYVEGLLDGRRDTPWPPGKAHKFVVFTMHPESTALISEACRSFGVPHCRLAGCRAQKDEAVRALREDVDVMLVTSAKDCSGLNIPFASHVVFYHRVIDRNIEAQVAARGQRLGREGNLEIVTLLNEAEAGEL